MIHHTQLTGADLSFALQSFKRVKSELKQAHTSAKNKQTTIDRLNRHLINRQSKFDQTTKTYTTTVAQLHDKINAQQQQLHDQLHRSRVESNSITKQLKSTTQQLIEFHLDYDLQDERNKTMCVEIQELRQQTNNLVERTLQLKEQAENSAHECNDVRAAHKETLLKAQHMNDQHQSKLLHWNFERNELTVALDTCRSEAVALVLQCREEKEYASNQVKTEEADTIAILNVVVQEEREKLESIAGELAREKLKSRQFQSELMFYQQHYQEKEKETAMLVVEHCSTTAGIVTTPPPPPPPPPASASVSASLNAQEPRLIVSVQKSDAYQRGLDSMAHLVIDQHRGMINSALTLNSLKTSMLELKEKL